MGTLSHKAKFISEYDKGFFSNAAWIKIFKIQIAALKGIHAGRGYSF